jgi:copper chaperone CopZ
MKKYIVTLLVLCFAIGAQAQKAMDSFEVQVDGLGCPFCAYGLEKKFKEFKGIKKVAIDIETGDFSFQYPAEKALTMTAVIAKVEKAGYTPNEAKITRANGEQEISGGIPTVLSEMSEVVSQQFFVAGKCGMCKARIESTALQIKGITTAVWNTENKQLQLNYDKSQTSIDAVQQKMAAVGHDTKHYPATQDDYEGLPACCHYERLEQE